MRVAVYDRYWSTAGGGEKFAAGVAAVLADDHEVTLLAHEPVDLDWLGERLALDLSRVKVEQVGLAGRIEAASAAYDLLVNLSFHSADRCGAPRGLYVVHFPVSADADVPPRQRALLHRFGPVLASRTMAWRAGAGFYPPDVVRLSRVRWTDGDAELSVTVPPGRRRRLHLLFGSMLPAGVELDAGVEVDGEPAGTIRLGPPAGRAEVVLGRRLAVTVHGHGDGSPVSIRIRSGTWVPAEVDGSDDERPLGVPLVGIATGASPVSWARGVGSLFEEYPPRVDFLDTYDRVLANSRFTQRWIHAWWDRESEVLYPPVGLRKFDPGAKRPVVLSVGRFFAARRGHSKKQLEMVHAWRELCNRPASRDTIEGEGWRLHLAGGCSAADRPYLDEVRAAAAGLPVDVDENVPGAELDRLYREASIYWHAAGLGEDEAAHPDRMEHFGITTVEAMSAGAVPVAYAAAGPLEAFHDGAEGHHFHTLEGLVEATERLLADPAQRSRLAMAASSRAAQFGMDAFADRLRGQIDRIV